MKEYITDRCLFIYNDLNSSGGGSEPETSSNSSTPHHIGEFTLSDQPFIDMPSTYMWRQTNAVTPKFIPFENIPQISEVQLHIQSPHFSDGILFWADQSAVREMEGPVGYIQSTTSVVLRVTFNLILCAFVSFLGARYFKCLSIILMWQLAAQLLYKNGSH